MNGSITIAKFMIRCLSRTFAVQSGPPPFSSAGRNDNDLAEGVVRRQSLFVCREYVAVLHNADFRVRTRPDDLFELAGSHDRHRTDNGELEANGERKEQSGGESVGRTNVMSLARVVGSLRWELGVQLCRRDVGLRAGQNGVEGWALVRGVEAAVVGVRWRGSEAEDFRHETS